ncbi:hypothetical protein EXE58_10595 [Nocardioides seonyuensis]|uniref:Uncharacterized protein n=1 Tax=Nocardioides seonyuensis TaxID=2518371 RepID=A0A4P7IGS4_9ACTN|nr:hypothetical protein [Nocardioides seonyuensis]QBX55863.1 hypothetical protein EXE58_10595 [Nocardioides seonyuensis]
MTAREVTCLRVAALGVVVPLEVHGADLGRAVAAAWRDALTDLAPSTETVSAALGRDVGARVTGDNVEEVLHHLSPAVTTVAIGARAGALVMLHAAALADPESGRTAVLVAPSGTGKTTASRALGGRFAYLSDETAAIESDGRVLPYRKPLSIIEGSHLKAQVAPSDLGLVTTERDCRLATLVLLDRAPEHAGPPAVEQLDTVDAVAEIARQASYLPSLDRPLHRLADLIHLAGGVRRVTYAEATDLEDVLADLLALEPRDLVS